MTDSYKEKGVDLDGRGTKKKLGERGNHNQNILNEGKTISNKRENNSNSHLMMRERFMGVFSEIYFIMFYQQSVVSCLKLEQP